MERELISKKELLDKYGISYGALYRWKRMGLIPEEWFIKKAAPTGQETFFDKVLICARMEEIIGSKDEASLKDLAEKFSEGQRGKRLLIVGTKFGETGYDFEQITVIKIKNGDKEIDITQELRRK
ncbi:MAG TPA: DUF4004 family protein [Oscillospiraceae bacterium]|nr:DUF4004 family protein [Oscillospiraceae bacterium]HPF56514.1 DUF4004 family protein [Clostridiales bacterium]HPK35481.1 DUF4004 family protein [Oscillospiraceae bacterium]HPR75205.1 DUF4004 family protein [Oscillospiraceae bacterium]